MSTATADEAFLKIVGARPAASEKDRRRSERVPMGALASVSQLVNGQALAAIHVVVTDASEGGLGLRSGMSLVRGGLYRVELHESSDLTTANVRVVSSRRRRDGSYDVGARHVNV